MWLDLTRLWITSIWLDYQFVICESRFLAVWSSCDYASLIHNTWIQSSHDESISEGLKGLTAYNTNKVEQRAEQVCLKLMTSAIPSFAKISDDIDNAKQTILQIINMVFMANFFKTNSTWDWKGFEKLVEVEVGVNSIYLAEVLNTLLLSINNHYYSHL